MTVPTAVADLVEPASFRPSDRLRRISGSPTARAAASVVAVFLISPLLATGSVSETAIVAMLPSAALIAIVAIGQTVVIQQRGLDLSVPGALTLSALIVAKYGAESSWGLVAALAVAIGVPIVAGLLSGVVITNAALPPLVVTIAANALLVGMVQFISGGFGAQAPDPLSSFALDRWFGVPTLAVVALVVVVGAQGVLKLTTVGRRFELVGESKPAAALIGIRVRRYEVAAYVVSGACAGLAGVLFAGLVRSPTLTSGDAFLLPSIAAVVLGGTALTGGKGSLTATALGALFLGQLDQLVQTATQNAAAQNVVQAVIIGVGITAQLRLPAAIGWFRNRGTARDRERRPPSGSDPDINEGALPS